MRGQPASESHNKSYNKSYNKFYNKVVTVLLHSYSTVEASAFAKP